MQGWLRAGSSIGEALGSVMMDVRFGLRTLRKKPLFTTLVVGTLGLGIGASTIVFSLVDGVLLRDMPYEQPGQLLTIWQTSPDWRGDEVLDDLWDKIGISWAEFLSLRENSQLFGEVAVYNNRTMVLTRSGTPERLEVGEVSSALFPMLGVRPLLGRAFLPGEEGPGTPRLVILSHSLWTSRFGSDPEIVGRTIELDQEPFEVIGVLPPGFRLRSTLFNLLRSATDTGDRALWVPIGFDGTALSDRSSPLEALGRLVPGATVEQARTELDALLRRGRTADELGFRLTHPKDEIIGGHRSSLLLLLAAAGILLLITCANIAALLMSEAVGRVHEVATRIAVGAGKLRIARQLLTESVLIGILGSVIGLVLAAVGIRSFLSLAPPLPRLEEVGMNHGVLLFSILAGVGTGILFGLAPAFLLHADSLRSAQGTGGRGSTGGRGRFQRSVMASELALTIVLLVTGGLLARSLVNLARVDPGFDASSVATLRIHFPTSALGERPNRGELITQILERIEAIPGVEHAGCVDKLPFPGMLSGTSILIEGRSTEENGVLVARKHFVLAGYFETMRIPLLAGRTFTEADARVDSPPVMLINEQAARQYWPNESPLGARLRWGRTVYEVVGIVGDIRERHLSEAPKAMIYRVTNIPLDLSIVARTEAAPEGLIAKLREATWAVDPELSLSQESTMTALVESSTGAERYRTILVTVFGILATLLASVGVFGITAHSVSKRTREMGIRMALGAQSGNLVRGVVFETMLPGVAGIGAGFLGALVVSRLLTSYLFGIEAWDAPTFCGVIILLGSLSIGAAVLPASRVGRVDPMRVLREE